MIIRYLNAQYMLSKYYNININDKREKFNYIIA